MNKRKAYSGKMNAEDKENQSFEPQESTLKTPLKQATTSNWFLAEIQPPASGHLTTPPKPHEISPGDPWTPTANLKMLISAASPEIRNREQEKRLSDSRSEILEDHLSGDEYEKSQPSRKEKSLGLLCHKFLARYPSYPNTSKNNEICLDEVAEELNVERRRIYDIVNVLESLHMVSRLAKNRYSWHGRHNLKKTLQILKKVAEENKYAQQIELIKRKQYEQELLGDDQKIELVAKQVRPNDHTDICFVELPGMEFRTVVNLEIAAKILIGEDYVEYLDKSKFKTKIRRLYDIANVLSSLELIKKVRVTEEKGRKPAFKWTGPDVFSEIQATQPVSTPTVIPLSHPVEGKSSKEHCSKNLFPTRSKQGFTRHPSLIKLTKSIQSDQRKIRSAPSSPFKKNTSQIPSSFPSKMAQLAAICKQQLDEQSREFKKRKMKLDSALPCTLASPPDCLKPESFLLPSQAEILPLMHSSVSPGMLPLHSNVSYALYLHPSQTQIMTAYNPSFMVQPVHCVNVIGIKSPVEDSSQIVPGKIFTEDNGSNLEEGVACAKCRDLCLEKEQEGTKDDVMPEKCFKRHKTSLEHSPIRKYMRDEEALQHVLVGESTVNQKSKSSIALHLDLEVFTSSAVKQIKHEKADQTLECQSKQQKQGDVLEYDSITTAQEMPATFAVPTPKTWFPSGYLIPLPHCTKLSNETTLYNKDKAEMCAAEQKSYSSHIAGGIPLTSEFTTVNFPAFHIAPLNLMLPPSSVTTVPVVNGTTIASGHADSIQAPSSSVQNFTLQHLGLIQASLQLSADQVPGNVPVCQGPELVNSASKSVGLKQGKAVYGHEVHRKSVPAASLQQTIVPVVSSISEKDGENTFQTPCEAAVVSDFCSSSCESDRISQETLVIPQREHDVSTEDKF